MDKNRHYQIRIESVKIEKSLKYSDFILNSYS